VAEIIIKQAVESDVDSVAAIVKRYRDFQGVKEQYIEEIASFIRARISGSESVILIAISQASGAVIGFVQLYPVFSTVSLQRQWLLNDFFVDEGERGAGVGSALMEAVKERFRNAAKGFILVTAKTNAGAKRFYEKHGWMTGSFDFYTYYYGTDDS
jgi:ribosomal protein S18 acetylase RimI-like enzyme